MAASAEQLLHAIQTIETQLTLIKQSLSELGIQETGVIGTFDGEAIALEDGRRQVIPPNYASKSMLVPGDTLRMTEDPTGGEQPRFKQISKVERTKATGLLTRKDGKFEVICEQGSFKVLAAAIKHFEGEAGDQVIIQFAKNHLKGSWAAVEKVIKSTNQPTPSAIKPSSIAHQEPEPAVAVPEIQPATVAPVVQAEPEAAQSIPSTTPPTPAAAQPRQTAKPASRSSKSRPARDNRSDGRSKYSTPARSSQPAAQPISKPVAPVAPPPMPQAAQPLAPSQGEIVIPNVMDDDELA